MNIVETFGMSIPVFAFSDMPEVVAAVSRAGGLGVLGALMSSPEELDRRLSWLDETLEGLPYGVDIVITAGHREDSTTSLSAAEAAVPQRHWDFVETLLTAHGVPPRSGLARRKVRAVGLAVEKESAAHVDVALAHKTRLLVNALGPPPPALVERCHDQHVYVGALVGSPAHVERQLARGVDLIIAQGTEAGGHCGDISTMVLVPEVVDVVAGRACVVAAGGIARGSQVVAALALGAAGVWTGSLWLASEEAGPYIDSATLHNLFAATSADTVRSRAMSGKPMRQLRTAWTDAWEGPESPGCLPAPLQGIVHHSTAPRFQAAGASGLCGYPVGQVVGQLKSLRPVATILDEIRRDMALTIGQIAAIPLP